VAVLAVDGHIKLGPHDGQVGLEFFGLGIACCVHIGDAAVDDVDSQTQQSLDDAIDVALVARDGMARQDDRVLIGDLHPAVLATGQQTER
jgi:hypothetical protein